MRNTKSNQLQINIQSLPPLKEIATACSLQRSDISSRFELHKLDTHPRMSMTDSIRTRASFISLPRESCFWALSSTERKDWDMLAMIPIAGAGLF